MSCKWYEKGACKHTEYHFRAQNNLHCCCAHCVIWYRFFVSASLSSSSLWLSSQPFTSTFYFGSSLITCRDSFHSFHSLIRRIRPLFVEQIEQTEFGVCVSFVFMKLAEVLATTMWASNARTSNMWFDSDESDDIKIVCDVVRQQRANLCLHKCLPCNGVYFFRLTNMSGEKFKISLLQAMRWQNEFEN